MYFYKLLQSLMLSVLYRQLQMTCIAEMLFILKTKALYYYYIVLLNIN